MTEWIVEANNLDELSLGFFSVNTKRLVRCKDCHYCKPFNEIWQLPKRNSIVCSKSLNDVETDDYCSWGIMRYETD